ncbi:hypothetical protein [Pseudomonas avellanae]|uniref:Uncharacterized protein n=1 Tax=Pseudomonas syringae pv. primulae TaxID=251707 RepID=A0A3M4S8M1_9PSED|nr:hypothetical protein [Pseudomonas avellanae]RMR11335.1 hypothetical protein ALP92_103646 [Pseudomonas syringae pv. primulae]
MLWQVVSHQQAEHSNQAWAARLAVQSVQQLASSSAVLLLRRSVQVWAAQRVVHWALTAATVQKRPLAVVWAQQAVTF